MKNPYNSNDTKKLLTHTTVQRHVTCCVTNYVLERSLVKKLRNVDTRFVNMWHSYSLLLSETDVFMTQTTYYLFTQFF